MELSTNSEQLASGVASPPNLGRFVIRARLGAGAFGVVYRAYDPVLEREVALKVAVPGALQNSEARARFLREPKIAAQLRHPHIVPIYDAGQDGHRYYIASAFIEGRTLANSLRDERPEFREAARIVRDLAQALDYAHRIGVIHRDVKPANIMIDRSEQALLMDFGLARLVHAEEKVPQDGTVMGTPAYMSPEQANPADGETGPASDQYSLGVVLYEMLCGQTPFTGRPAALIAQLLNATPAAPRQREPSVPQDLETICLKAMAKRPNDRYVTCGELAEDLRRWLADEPIRARRMNAGEQAWRWAKRNRVLAVLAAAALVFAVVSTSSAVRLFLLRRELAQAVASELKQSELAQRHIRETRDKRRLAEARELAATESERGAQEALTRLQSALEKRGEAEAAASAESEDRTQAEKELQRQKAEYVRLEQARQEQEKAAKDARKKEQVERAAREVTSGMIEQSVGPSKWRRYTELLTDADRAIQAGNVNEAVAALDGCPAELRAWEWHYLRALSQGMKPQEETSVTDADGRAWDSGCWFGPNLSWLCAALQGSYNRRLRGYVAVEQRTMFWHPSAYNVIVSPDAKYAYQGIPIGHSFAGLLVRINRAGEAERMIPARGDELGTGCSFFQGRYYSAFGPDGSLAYVSSDGAIYRYWLADRRRIEVENPLEVAPMAVCFDPSGELMVSSFTHDVALQVWRIRIANVNTANTSEPTNWRVDVQVPATDRKVQKSVARVSDFLIADEGRKCLVWPGSGGRECYAWTIGSTSPPSSVPGAIALSPDGQRIAFHGATRVVLRHADSGAELPMLSSLGWFRGGVEYSSANAGWHNDLGPEYRYSCAAAVSWDWTRAAAMFTVVDNQGTDHHHLYYWAIPHPVGDGSDN